MTKRTEKGPTEGPAEAMRNAALRLVCAVDPCGYFGCEDDIRLLANSVLAEHFPSVADLPAPEPLTAERIMAEFDRQNVGPSLPQVVVNTVRALSAHPTESDSESPEAAFDERAEFEASMRSCSTISLQRDPEDPDSYYRSVAEAAWIAWQIRADLEKEPGSRGLASLRSPSAASGLDANSRSDDKEEGGKPA